MIACERENAFSASVARPKNILPPSCYASAMRMMVLLLALLALVGGAALGFVFFEVLQPHPVERVPAP